MTSRLGHTMYHFHIRPVSRGKGHSLASRISYIQNKRFLSNGYIKNRTKKRSYVQPISSLPNWFSEGDVQQYIDAVEEVETRKNSRFGREIIVALVREMKNEDSIKAIDTFLGKLKEFQLYGVGAIHDFNSKNPHTHIIINERELLRNGKLGRKLIEYNSKSFLITLRKAWADAVNETIKRGGYQDQIAPVSHLSFKDLGLDYRPTQKVGNRRPPENTASVQLHNESIVTNNTITKLSQEIQNTKMEIEFMAELNRSQEEHIKDDLLSPYCLSDCPEYDQLLKREYAETKQQLKEMQEIKQPKEANASETEPASHQVIASERQEQALPKEAIANEEEPLKKEAAVNEEETISHQVVASEKQEQAPPEEAITHGERPINQETATLEKHQSENITDSDITIYPRHVELHKETATNEENPISRGVTTLEKRRSEDIADSDIPVYPQYIKPHKETATNNENSASHQPDKTVKAECRADVKPDTQQAQNQQKANSKKISNIKAKPAMEKSPNPTRLPPKDSNTEVAHRKAPFFHSSFVNLGRMHKSQDSSTKSAHRKMPFFHNSFVAPGWIHNFATTHNNINKMENNR